MLRTGSTGHDWVSGEPGWLKRVPNALPGCRHTPGRRGRGCGWTRAGGWAHTLPGACPLHASSAHPQCTAHPRGSQCWGALRSTADWARAWTHGSAQVLSPSASLLQAPSPVCQARLHPSCLCRLRALSMQSMLRWLARQPWTLHVILPTWPASSAGQPSASLQAAVQRATLRCDGRQTKLTELACRQWCVHSVWSACMLLSISVVPGQHTACSYRQGATPASPLSPFLALISGQDISFQMQGNLKTRDCSLQLPAACMASIAGKSCYTGQQRLKGDVV